MDDALGLSVDNETGFLTVSADSADPETLVAMIVAATEATDELMKERYVINAEQTLQLLFCQWPLLRWCWPLYLKRKRALLLLRFGGL